MKMDNLEFELYTSKLRTIINSLGDLNKDLEYVIKIVDEWRMKGVELSDNHKEEIFKLERDFTEKHEKFNELTDM